MNTNPTAKRILIYGDSYTFGKIPAGARHPANIRFTGVLQNALGQDYEIVEEGLRGRMIEGQNSFFPERDGLQQFGPIFGSHLPLDFLILFLGTNDANSGAHKTPEQIVKSYDAYLEKVKWWGEHLEFPKPKILLVAPPKIIEEESYKVFNDIFREAGPKIFALSKLIKDYAQEHDCLFFDASEIPVSKADGIHLDEEANKELGEKLAAFIKTAHSDMLSSSLQNPL